ncbi:MAG: hypothetical protein CVU44_04450 [Chloroflexi bacterium HGW-Chloroflexi-6]|nr:MAG: hypothetical protein CVU44_04450 [Chloroflexi bacterium HGW-Chloroflexi-6]
MSRDPVTITRAEAIRRRREEQEQRREGATRKRSSTPLPASTRIKTERPPLSVTPASKGRLRRRYDIAMSSPYGRTSRGGGRTLEIPAITLPRLSYGPRWISFFFLVACLGLIYGMYTSNIYLINEITVTGNQRIQVEELQAVLGVWNQPAFTINPAQVEYNLLASYPELISVHVEVGLPATIVIELRERVPVLSWRQNGQVTWVDADGYAFAPRGSLDGLAAVEAMGQPPLPANFDANQKLGARPFLTPELARAITAMSPTMPEGASLVYDPEYGLGWQDPLGWQVYFGHSGEDMPVKLNVYLSMVEYLMTRDIQPALISVEYPSAPFYRLEN